MSEAEFDEFEKSYDDEMAQAIAFGGQDHDFYMQVKVDAMLDATERLVGKAPSDCTFLDVGCGVGATSKMLVDRVGELHGIDPSEGLVRTASEQVPGVNFVSYDGEHMPYEDNTFDVAYVICVMHHVLPEQWESFCLEIQRVLKPGGAIMVFEHNALNPATMHVVNTCAFDEHAVLLSMKKTKELLAGAGTEIAESRYILFVPLKGKLFRILDSLLKWLPLGAQYYVVGRKPALARDA